MQFINIKENLQITQLHPFWKGVLGIVLSLQSTAQYLINLLMLNLIQHLQPIMDDVMLVLRFGIALLTLLSLIKGLRQKKPNDKV
jgi:hypothetical protein